MILLWAIALIAGLAAASLASRRAVTHALAATDGTRVSSGFVGMTVLAIGTDLPEIANSIISAVTDHGDLNVGDSAGSAVTQVTLVLGILCFGARLASDRRTVVALGLLTSAALVSIGMLLRDGSFDRSDGAMLLVGWVVVVGAMKFVSFEPVTAPDSTGQVRRDIARAGGWLVVVAVAATVVVQSFVAIAESVAVPEVVAGAIVLALGTSLPELIVDWTAVRRGATALALGDLFGSSFLDATLAIGIGPAITPTLISDAATTTCVIAACGVLGATVVAGSKSHLGRGSAGALIAVYAATTAALVLVAR